MRFSFPSHYKLALLSGILLWASWPVSPLTFLLFIAFVPLFIADIKTQSNRSFFSTLYIAFFIWNICATWWIVNASVIGAALAIVLNSLFMCIPWMLARSVRRLLGNMPGYLALICFWITYEFIHHNWDLSWPWLTLGNAFAQQPAWVQWYAYTGTTGGTLWVLLANIAAFRVWKGWKEHGVLKKFKERTIILLAVILLPVGYGFYIKYSRAEMLAQHSAKRNIVVVQPNVDPYNEKFTEGTEAAQIQNLIQLSEKAMDSSTALVLWPETAIPVQVNEEALSENILYHAVWQFLQRHPQLALLSGINGYKVYETRATPTARATGDGQFYDAFNTAALFYSRDSVQFYHKAKLVPGVESLPSYLSFLNPVFEKFGGGSMGRDAARKVFKDRQGYYFAAPIICYESIYSDYVTQYVRMGANVLTIITNDGWWGDTPGYKQHLAYAKLRAIETRRYVARSANTGISAFIDPLGNVLQPQLWDTKAVIKMNVAPLQQQTFYVRYGDYLSRIFGLAALVFLVILIIFKWRSRQSNKLNYA